MSTTLVAQIEIWEIQGSTNSSPYENATVTTNENIVTAKGPDRFYIQTPIIRSDQNELTSDGIMVYTGTTPLVNIGDLINLTGTIQEYNNVTEFASEGLSYEIINIGQTLPEAILLDENFPSTLAADVADLERVEGMRVQVINAITTGPTEYSGTYITTQTTRSFRESGIAFPGESALPVWDGNPEVFLFYPNILDGGTAPLLSSKTLINATGVMGHIDYSYVFYPVEYELDGGPILQAVRDPQALEVSIGCINLLMFDDNNSDFDLRVTKTARYIVELMKAPDIIALQEIENVQVLNKLTDKITELFPDITYTAFSPSTANSDDFSINLGYLVRPSVIEVKTTPLGSSESLSLGGSLHSRPPLLLEGFFSTDPPTPINVLNIHIRSLNGITGSSSTFVRTKRHEQAISIAQMIKAKRNSNLVIVGDFNGYQFSDGYVDVVNQITGNSSLGAEYPVIPVNDPSIIHYNLDLPEQEQYSYVYNGNAQMIDHCLSTELNRINAMGMEYIRANADNPDNYFDDPNVLYRISDHDGFVLFMQLQDSITTLQQPEFTGRFAYPNPFLENNLIYLDLERGDQLKVYLYALDGKLIYSRDFGFFDKGEVELKPDFRRTEGMYLLRVEGNHFDEAGLIFVGE